MDFIKGEDRILYFKINGDWLPVGCLTENALDETSDFIDTTTRDNQGWKTSRPTNQGYNISFAGLQVISTVAGGNFNVASLDKLRQLKRNRTLLEWKFQGKVYPIVDFGKCYIADLSDGNITGELISFSGSAIGYGKPMTQTLGTVLLNNGDPNVIVNSGNENELIRVSRI
jgi:hypothetical protein